MKILLPALVLALLGCSQQPPSQRWEDLPHPVGVSSKMQTDEVKVLENAEELELLSIEPGATDKGPNFRGYKLLGKTIVRDKDQRKQILAAIYKSTLEDVLAESCFVPFQVVRASAGGKKVDLVFSFDCNDVRVFCNDQEESSYTLGQSAKAVLNKFLTDAGVPLAEEAQ